MKPNFALLVKKMFLSLFIFVNVFSLWGSSFMIKPVQAAPALTTYVVPAISDNKILPKFPVETQYLSNRIDTYMAKGEYKALSFVVNSSEDIANFQVEATDLTGSAGTIPAANIDIKAVKVWYQSGNINWVNATTNRYLTPELLLKDDSLVGVDGDDWSAWNVSNPAGKNYLKVNGAYQDISITTPPASDLPLPVADRPIQDATTLQPLNLPSNYNKQFWLTVYVKKDAVAGNYAGKINLKSAGVNLKSMDLNLQVLSIDLPNPSLDYSMYYYGYLGDTYNVDGSVTPYPGSISYSRKSVTQFTAEQINMLEHGVKNPATYQYADPNNLKNMMQIRRDNGIDNTNLYYALSTTNRLALYQTMLAPYGVSTIYKYGRDEQDLNNPTDRADIQAVHDLGGKYFVAQSNAQADGVADVLDLAIVSGQPSSTLAQKYHSFGHRIFSYANPQGAPEFPHTFRKNYGLLLWQKDYDGAMPYIYQRGFGDIWNDFDNTTYRDHNFTYPTANGVIDTVQWEGFREGVNDVRYLTKLNTLIQEAKAAGTYPAVVQAAESYLQSIKASDLNSQNLEAIRAQIVTYILGFSSSPKYYLTVNGGSGSGFYPTNTVVSIAASTAPVGTGFIGWTGDVSTIANGYASPTTVTVQNSALSVTANYSVLSWQEPDYAYKKNIIINHNKVSNTDQTNFPVLLSFTDPDLRTVANGGHLQNGYDFIFILSDGTRLNYETEKYDPTTGKLTAWVKVPNLSAIQDTYITIYYGNPNIVSSQANPTGVWTSSYKGVWHLNETGTGQVGDYKDSTANAFHSTNIIEQPTVTEGKITTGQAFTGATGREVIETSGTDGLNISNAITLSGWVKLNKDVANAYEAIISKKSDIPTTGQRLSYGLTLGWNSLQTLLFCATEQNLGSNIWTSNTLQAGQWEYVVATYDSTKNTAVIYINGDIARNSIGGIQGALLPGTKADGSSYPTVLGKGSTSSLDGLLDEARISSTARSADWIKTEYLNQSSPSTFYTLSAEENKLTPRLLSLTTSLTSGNYNTSTSIPLLANFSRPVSGDLIFSLKLDNQTRTCTTQVISSTRAVCNYTVQASDQTGKLAVTLSGNVKDSYGSAPISYIPVTNDFTTRIITFNLNGSVPLTTSTSGSIPNSTTTTPSSPLPDSSPSKPTPSCPYPDGTLARAEGSTRVYAVQNCKKRWVPTSEVMEQLGYAWSNVQTWSSSQIDALTDYEDNLIRAYNDYKIFLVVNGVKRHLPNPEVFLNYGFKWSDVKEVDPSVVDQYKNAYLLKVSQAEPIYFFTRGIRKYIPTMEIFNSYQDKLEDVQVISSYEMSQYFESSLVRLENSPDVYLITDNHTTRRHIPNPTIFNKHRFNWNHIISVNPFEFYYYRWGSDVR